jgi:hypothetical protein
MRVNCLVAVRKWLPTAQAMTTMLRTLHTYPDKGFLGGQTILYWRGIGLLQYWRSFEDVERFARSPAEPHLAAWRRFTKTIGADGTVGFWHETYLSEPGKHEAVYGNMPLFGLAAVARHVPAAAWAVSMSPPMPWRPVRRSVAGICALSRDHDKPRVKVEGWLQHTSWRC